MLDQSLLWTVCINHEYGSDQTIHATEDAARDRLWNFAREYWKELPDHVLLHLPTPVSLDKYKATEIFFEESMDTYEIQSAHVDGALVLANIDMEKTLRALEEVEAVMAWVDQEMQEHEQIDFKDIEMAVDLIEKLVAAARDKTTVTA